MKKLSLKQLTQKLISMMLDGEAKNPLFEQYLREAQSRTPQTSDKKEA